MKKGYIVPIVVAVILLIIVGIFIYERAHVSFHSDENGTSVSVIGGADGPTSVFIAGKIGGDSDVNEGIVQEIEKMQIEIQIGDMSMLAELENNDSTEELIGLSRSLKG